MLEDADFESSQTAVFTRVKEYIKSIGCSVFELDPFDVWSTDSDFSENDLNLRKFCGSNDTFLLFVSTGPNKDNNKGNNI